MKEQRLLYRLALVLLLGTVLGAGRPGIHNCIAITGALGLMLWSFFCRRREAYILLAVFLLGAGMSFFLPTASYLNTETVSLTGTVRDVKTGEDVHRLTVKTPKGRVYVETDESLAPGMRIAVRGQITTRTGSHNPGVFDYENYLWTENVLGILEHDDVTELTILPGTRPIQKLLGNLSVHGREKILSIHRLSEEHRALLVAMTLGDRDGLTPETESLFRRTMVYHVLAVSGLHVTAVLGAVGHLLGRVRFLKPGVRFGLSVFVMAFYVLLTGAPDSAIRAGIMGFCVLAAPAVFRRYGRNAALAFAVMLLLFLNPRAAFQPGVQYTCLAILGITVMTDPLGQLLEQKHPVLRHSIQGLLISLGTTFALLPLLCMNSGHMSLYMILINLLTVPVSSVLVMLGLILLLLPAGLATPVALMTDATADLLLYILRFCDRLPGNFVITARLPLILILLFYAAVLLLPLLKQKQAARVTVALALCLTLMTGFAAVYEKPARGFEVHVLDVGMGNSTLIRTGDENILIDSGRPYAAENAVLPYLRSLGIRQLDAIFYSHADSDHMGGNRMLLEAYPDAKVYLPRVQDGRFIYLESLGATHLRQGDRVEFDQLAIDVLHPTDSRVMEPLDNRNEYSLALRVSNGTNQVVLMGDYEGLPVPFGPKCDMIVLPHHGADFETLERLLVLADPACAVLSVGRDNDYGLPETGTIATLEKLKIPTRRTDRDGAIIYRADRGQITVWSAGKETLHGIANG